MLSAAAGAARDRGYDTTVCFSEVARDRPWLSELGEVADIRFIERSSLRGTVRQLNQILHEPSVEPTIVHTHFGTFDEAAALLRARHRRRRVFWHAHSGRARRIRIRTKLHAAVFGRIVDGVICVSPLMRDEALALGFPATKLRLLPNAIDPTRFPPISPGERAAARQALELPARTKVVLHFAWDWNIKGGDLLLSVADAMDRDEDLMFLTVLGEQGGDAPLRELELHRTVRAIAPRADVNELYATADAFLNCSRVEGGLPYAVIEALARGLPAVVTTPPVRAEVVAGLPGGRSVAPQARTIASALDEVLSLTEAQRSEHAGEARNRVQISYALDRWAARLVDLYDEALGR
ncbi:MAG TPA: glycosyltransferase family 4 protein [Solirubrobacteraceae bacterium]|nr:glycosyltransferase family 4 protein [Solirubrobacteraceae bacterium]